MRLNRNLIIHGYEREKMVISIKEKYPNDPIIDESILNAMRKIPRHLFIPADQRHLAYHDGPVPIGEQQTISQPYIVAYMTDILSLKKDSKVLEVGTGSGYQTAVLAEIVKKVYTIERIPALAKSAKLIFKELEYENIVTRVGDGSIGWSELAPFDRIIITAAAPEIPKIILEQLSDDGIIVAPIGSKDIQTLIQIHRKGDKFTKKSFGGCIFVPLKGVKGWK